jgi:hypothetical protein
VVFAGNRPAWIGYLAEQPTPERIKEIRDLKQFGTLFDGKDPAVLPIMPQPGRTASALGRFAVVSEPVNWSDPQGDWRLILMEDLSVSVSNTDNILIGMAIGLAVLGLLTIMLNALRSRHAKRLAVAQLEAFAQRQQLAVERKSQLATAAVHMQQAHDSRQIAHVFLLEAHQLLGAFQGAVYVADATHDAQLQLAASYACAEGLKETLAPGEGLLGECALAGHARVIETPAPGIWSIQSGLGHVQPAAVMLGPATTQDMLLGVVELALLTVPDQEQQQLFDEMLDLLALNLKLAARNLAEAPRSAPAGQRTPEDRLS